MATVLIDIPRDSVAELCRKHGVAGLWVFGSAVVVDGEEPAFDAARSDVDFLVEFVDLPAGGRALAFFGLERDLAQLLGRRVDLAEPDGVRNPIVKAEMMRRRVPLYAAA